MWGHQCHETNTLVTMRFPHGGTTIIIEMGIVKEEKKIGGGILLGETRASQAGRLVLLKQQLGYCARLYYVGLYVCDSACAAKSKKFCLCVCLHLHMLRIGKMYVWSAIVPIQYTCIPH